MSQKTRKGRGKGTKRRATPGSFRPGYDPRRYAFTRQDCRKGFRVTVCTYPHVLDWVMARFLTQRDRRRRELAEIPW